MRFRANLLLRLANLRRLKKHLPHGPRIRKRDRQLRPVFRSARCPHCGRTCVMKVS